MCGSEKTKVTLIEELQTLRSRAAELERIEAEHKKVEQKLKQYQFMVESAHDVIFFKDLNGRYVIANDKTLEAFGLPREQVIGKNDYEIMPKKAEAGKNIEDDKLVFKTGKPTEITKHMTGSDGKERWFRAIKVPQFDNNGNIIGLIGIAHDITVHRKTHEELQAKTAVLQNIISNIPFYVFWKDKNSVYLGCNDKFVKLAGLEKAEDIIGKSDCDLPWKKEESDFYRKIDKEVMTKVTPILNIEESVHQPDGKVATVLTSKVPMQNANGEVTGVLGIFTDITERKKAEEALTKSKVQAEKYLNIAKVMIAAVDANEKINMINKKGCEYLGYKERELIGKNWFNLLVPKRIRKDVRGVFNNLMAGKVKPVEFYENELLTKKGEERLFAFYNTILKDSGGKINGVLFSAEDITERKKAEEEIKRAAEEWDRTFNAIADLVFIQDKDFTITKMNKALPEALKLKPEDIIGKKCYELLHKSDKPWPGCPFEKTVKDKEPRTQEVDDPNIGIPLLISTSPIFDGNGKLVGAVHIAKDITERKKAEEELLFKSTLLEAQSEASIDGILVVDSEGKSISFNKNFGRMWNIPQQILDTRDDEKMLQHVLYQLKNPEQFLEKVRYLYAHQNEKSRDEIQFKDGRVFDRYSSPLLDSNDKYCGRVWYFSNITERKRAEDGLQQARDELEIRVEQRTADLARANVQLRSLASELPLAEERLRRRIADNVHDHVGQNLAISKIKIESLRESATSPELAEDLEEIRDLIAQTIESTRSLTFELSPPVLYELGFEAAVEWLVRQTRQQYSLSADFKADGQTKPLDNNVRILLFQAVRELLVNVVKHAQAHNVTVSTRRVGNEIRVSVEDDGVGFDISRTGSHDYKTGGFGLFSIRERLGHIGGRLEVESKPGLGARITLTVPIDQESRNSKEQRK